MITRRPTPVMLASVAMASAVGCGDVSAEFIDCSGTAKMTAETSRTVIVPQANRELAQVMRTWGISSKHPEFEGTERTVYMHLDHLNGTGVHSGYWVFVLNSEEKLRAKFEGSHFTEVQAGRWETRFQGVFHFIYGTGKYESIRGGGYYHGAESATGGVETFGCSASY